MKKLVLCSVLLLWGFITYAQSNITITGTVKSQTSGKGISNVSVFIQQTNHETITDEKGKYSISLEKGNYNILFSAISYQQTIKNIIVDRESLILDVTLKKNITGLEEVFINGGNNKTNKKILSVNKLGIKNIDIPVTTNSINGEIMQQRNVSDIGDAVKSVTGVRPINRYGGFQTFRIRGFNNFVMLVDGVRDERHNISTSAPSTNLVNVERIEVLKGPAGVLYGHSALGGIINIVRKKPTHNQKANFKATYGSYDTYNTEGGVSGPVSDKLRYRVDIGMTRTQGWRDYGIATNNGSLMLDYTPSANDKLAFYFQTNKDVYDTDTGIPVDEDSSIISGMDPETRYNDPQDYLKHKRLDYQIKYSHDFDPNLKLSNLLSYSNDDIDYLSTEFLELNPTKDSITRAFPFYFNHQTKTLQNQLDLSYTFKTSTIEHKALLGNSISILDRKTFRGEVIGPGTFTTISVQNPTLNQGHIETIDNKVDIKKEVVYAFYLQDWIKFSDKFKALIGLRYDTFTGTYYRDIINNNRALITSGVRTKIPSSSFSYRAGIVYQPVKDMISIFASYSNYFKPSRRVTPNGKVFDPETGFQNELGIKFQKNELFTATLSAYYMLKNNIVEKTNVDDYQQIGSADSKGIELDIESKPFEGFYIKAGYAFVDAKIRDYNKTLQTVPAGNRLPYAPKNSINFWGNYEFQKGYLHGLGIGLGLNYVGKNYTNSSNTYTLPSYTTIDGSLYYQAKKVRIGLNINNIADTLYFTDAIYSNQFFPGQGRNYKLSLAYKF
ncbi:TonB-dependent receptor [Aquimarina megaterium]|uniref:TonB-dependent receptor n=1 Tax=Aquimarina megaterium TaxID=1443666 RepID=UPI000470A14C|nr:TonB-dependent receptor [Aquimarina megaterium]